MKIKKKNGFTLVELLATIIILGILMGMGLPILMRTIQTNRKKLYVSDAEKLISLADYKLKSNSSEIEKPDPDSCVIFSMSFLDDGSFESAPNDGEYDKEASFVVAKNVNNGDIEFSVMLVENKKGSFLGIPLTKDDNLKQNGVSVVSSLQGNQLKYVFDRENNTDSSKILIDEEYINSFLSPASEDGYIETIMALYY